MHCGALGDRTRCGWRFAHSRDPADLQSRLKRFRSRRTIGAEGFDHALELRLRRLGLPHRGNVIQPRVGAQRLPWVDDPE